jgi:hypothetical protein
MSVLGMTRVGDYVSVLDDLVLDNGKYLELSNAFTMQWDAGTSKLKFTRDGVATPPLVISATGGDLHGTWSAESIVSASDRRLKQEISPLSSTLQESDSRKSSSDAQTASRLLQALNPKHFTIAGRQASTTTSSHRPEDPSIRFDAEEVEKVLPELVRPTSGIAPSSGSTVGKGVLYQDFIAVLTLAAQERQRQLEQHQIREAEEVLRIRQQDEMIELMERQVQALSGRFTRLRGMSPIPPKWAG